MLKIGRWQIGLWVKKNLRSDAEHFKDTHFKILSILHIFICIQHG